MFLGQSVSSTNFSILSDTFVTELVLKVAAWFSNADLNPHICFTAPLIFYTLFQTLQLQSFT